MKRHRTTGPPKPPSPAHPTPPFAPARERARRVLALVLIGCVVATSAFAARSTNDPVVLPVREPLHTEQEVKALKEAEVIAQGLPASPGAATGQIVFFADEAAKYKNSILVRIETSPEDVEGMNLARGIVTARGGMTSHAAVVARGMGKCCVSGAGALKINYKTRTLTVGDHEYHEGDWISINGSTGNILEGKVGTKERRGDRSS